MNGILQASGDALNLVHSTPEDQKHLPAFGSRLNNLAVIRQAEGRFAEADGLYKQSLSVWEQTLEPEHPKIAQSLSNRASLYRLMYEFHEAERVFQLALNIWDRRNWPVESDMAQAELHDDKPLWADQVERDGTVRQFRAQVRDLRRRVESGSPEAQEELKKMLQKMGPWFHNLNFGGIDSNPSDPGYPERRWNVLKPLVPANLEGKTVLDIGCNGGFLSLEMKKLKAKRVVSVDFMPHLLGQTRFASYWFDLPLEPRVLDVYDIEALREQFDVVVFVGVLYHLKHPLYALEKVANVCRDTLVFQSLMRDPIGDFTPAENYRYEDNSFFQDPRFPRMYFLEKSFNNDSSNWWIANQSCLMAMLRVAGFADIKVASDPDHFVCRKTK
jgi:tRNA (mo5U34)-methyltransferase